MGSPQAPASLGSTATPLCFNFLTLSIKLSRAAPEGVLTVLQGRGHKANVPPEGSHQCVWGFDQHDQHRVARMTLTQPSTVYGHCKTRVENVL